MIDNAILTAVPAHLITYISELNSDNCQATPDDKPLSVAGDIFVSVFIQEVQGKGNPNHRYFEQLWGFGVTISKRIKAVPNRRIVPSVYLSQTAGLSDLATDIQYALVNRYEVMNAINDELVCDSQLEQFITSMRFMNPPLLMNRQTRPVFRDEAWWHGSHLPLRDNQDGHVGLSLGFNFGNMLLSAKLTSESCSG